ncbi:hypothetical protein [Streptomyces albipurpureus]|nr:hypothetical protein [Streptomyces sp. CWNU-1]
MSAERLHGFRQDIRRVAIDPRGFGDPVGGLRDKRRAVLAGTVTDYWISGSVLTVTVVTIVHTD